MEYTHRSPDAMDPWLFADNTQGEGRIMNERPQNSTGSEPAIPQWHRIMNERPQSCLCSQCVFWRKSGNKTGECRVNPPRMKQDHTAVWPVTGANEWCGEWSDVWELAEAYEEPEGGIA